MSAQDWLYHLSRLMRSGSQLASSGQQYVALAKAQELANEYEKTLAALAVREPFEYTPFLGSPVSSLSSAGCLGALEPYTPVAFAPPSTPSEPPDNPYKEQDWPSRRPGYKKPTAPRPKKIGR